MRNFESVEEFRAWFENHVLLGGKPYTLDLDQAKAALDGHKNTLVTARAGSGKTRVIVAKVAYLVASGQAYLNEIAAFMFNRAAAAEVNERIGAVEIDGIPLKEWGGKEHEICIASTFHKFALDLIKATGDRLEIISELEHDRIIRQALAKVLAEQEYRLPHAKQEEILRLASSFIARAGQQFSGKCGLSELCLAVQKYCTEHAAETDFAERVFIHKTSLAVYQEYLLALNFPKIDFNLLMSCAARTLKDGMEQNVVDAGKFRSKMQQIARYKYLLVDEYQDFSYLFYDLIRSIRQNCPAAHLFAVGDDWQAINRFAGSDVGYFIDFVKIFPEDVINIPLMTNYRSDRRIVENANRYMLKNYNSKADKAVPFSRKNGKIKRINPEKTKFDSQDLLEDGLGDGRYQVALSETVRAAVSKNVMVQDLTPKDFQEAAKLLKTVYCIVKKHRKEQILLLHRHNFTSFANVSLESFYQALRRLLVEEGIMREADFNDRVRCMTMHKSKGLESDVVVLLEMNRSQVRAEHPHATIFEIFGDTRAAETADQHRLLYVALTRAKHKLYILSSDKKPVA